MFIFFHVKLGFEGDGAPTYVLESLPMATDNAETQLLVPTEEYLNTNDMKELLAKENVLDGHPVPGSASVEEHEVKGLQNN